MKRTLKKVGLHKPESERTKAQKIARDVACFGVVIFAAVVGFLYGKAETDLTVEECRSAEISVEHAAAATGMSDVVSEVTLNVVD